MNKFYIYTIGMTAVVNALTFGSMNASAASVDNSLLPVAGSLQQTGVQEAKPEVSLQLEAGVASILSASALSDTFDESELENIDFWGYTNLGIANVDNHLNVRSGPGSDYKIVGKMSNNAACEIISLNGDWACIVSGKVEGYVSLEFLLTGVEALKRAESVVMPMAVVTTDGLRVRNEPNLESEIITQVPTGEELEAVMDGTAPEGWVKVLIDADEAYVSSEFVSVEEKLSTAITMTELLYGEGVSDVRVSLCEYAKEFIGNPYVWGGTSLTKGADCSGFVMSVYKKFGVTLPHSSRSQATYGKKVDYSALKPGDLVFYGSKSGINHVAIYIGGGQVVHASSPKTGIRISSLYYRSPVTARSILQD